MDTYRFDDAYKTVYEYDLEQDVKEIKNRLDNYIPINPIQATVLPPKSKIKELLPQVGGQVRDQVWNQVRDQVRAQVGAQVWAQVWDQVWVQVRDQVEAQVRTIGYYAIKDFMNLDYDHPAFDLVKLGVVIMQVGEKTKVFGKNGMFLGEY